MPASLAAERAGSQVGLYAADWSAAAKEPPPAEEKFAEVILPENGTGRVTLQWNANKSKWAPAKAKGAASGSGYPKEPAGPLPKGKYMVKVVSPLVNVFEGAEHEVSSPSVQIEVGK